MDPNFNHIFSFQQRQFPYTRLAKPFRVQTPVSLEEVKRIIEDKLNGTDNLKIKRPKSQCRSNISDRKNIIEKKPQNFSCKDKHFYPKFSLNNHQKPFIFKELKLRCPSPILKAKKTMILPKKQKKQSYMNIRKLPSPLGFLDINEGKNKNSQFCVNSSSSSLSDRFAGATIYGHLM
ncbi:hypothetical protein SteCoe_31588 [Stentor coeruleus]|uniref:Uncharacterized protein n=1 Tax=Stentor coeruleus TaxID=5963 RepID=A0A1R2B0Y7_9CILI|nr:hypothetical protein SteCoe_31588 [Stentor coeruleus]